MELPMVVEVAVAVLLLLPVGFLTYTASCPGSMDDKVPAAVKQEATSPPVGCVAPRCPDVLLVYALRLRSAGREELDVVRREGRRDDVGEGVHVRWHPGKGADDEERHPGAVRLRRPQGCLARRRTLRRTGDAPG